MRRLIAALLLALVVTVPFASAADIDDTPEAVALYQQADAAMRAGNWQEARRITEELATRFADSPNRDLFLFDHAKATYHSGNHAAAMAELDRFQNQYPHSPYKDHAAYFWANCALALNQNDKAIPVYVRTFEQTADPRLRELIADALATLSFPALSEAFLERTSGYVGDNCGLIRAVASHLMGQQRVDDATALVRHCENQAVPADQNDVLPATVRVAVVVPLSGDYQQFGEEILNGAMIASQSTSTNGRAISIMPFDTEADPVMAGRIVRELSRLKYDAIIGPLTSDESAVVAASLTDGRIPVLIPAATGAGLTLLGSNVYQLSPNLALQGVTLAEYARRNLNADSAAIITPTRGEHLQIGQAFARRFEQLGGTIVGVEYYRSSDRDFGKYIHSVKKQILPSLDESAVYLDAKGDTVEAEAVIAQVDCIFLPGPVEQLRLLVPQMRFYNLLGAYLGSDSWGSDEMYALGDDVTRGALFASPFIQKGSEPGTFRRDYTARYGTEPTRLASLGYDAAKLLMTALAKNPPSRVDWITDIANTGKFEGAAGRITFGEFRENIELPLYKIQAGKPLLVSLNRGAAASPDPKK